MTAFVFPTRRMLLRDMAKLAEFDCEIVLFGHGQPELEKASTRGGEPARRGG